MTKDDFKKRTARKMQREKVKQNKPIDKTRLYEFGQQDEEPYIIADDSEDAVIVIRDYYKQPRYGPTQMTVQKIVEGECKHCGSNRLEFGRKEPAGVSYTSCPVCNRSTIDTDYKFKFELNE